MFLKNTAYFYFLLVLGMFCASCKKAPNYPKVPAIEFKTLTIAHDTINKVDSITVVIAFQDGDGDIGNSPADPNHFDFFLDIYRKTDGVYKRMDYFDTIVPNNNGYLPLLSPYDLSGPIDGLITHKMDPFVFPLVAGAPTPYNKNDTLRFQIRIRDRANNYSNWVETSPEYIVWQKYSL